MRTLLAGLWTSLVLAQAALWWRAVALYPSVPDRFPIHFDLAGNPDNWASKSINAWFFVPLLATVVALGLAMLAGLALPRLARRAPAMINLPHKQRFLTLDPERREQALSPVACFLLYVAILTSLLFIWILQTMARGSTGLQGLALLWPGTFTALNLGGLVVMMLTLHRHLAPATAASVPKSHNPA